jgi:hypothetical protein
MMLAGVAIYAGLATGMAIFWYRLWTQEVRQNLEFVATIGVQNGDADTLRKQLAQAQVEIADWKREATMNKEIAREYVEGLLAIAEGDPL